jgi:PLP dependent protein
MSIAENTSQVLDRIAAAARRAGREPDTITLMAVSKTFPPTAIREAYGAGVRVFGENRVQEFSEKADALQDLKDAEWHLIGHLQTNKAAKAAELFCAVDSLDSMRLAEKLDATAGKLEKRLRVLVEVNVGREQQKTGTRPEELEQILRQIGELKNLQVKGLMTVPPYTEDPHGARPYFRTLRELRDRMATLALAGIDMDVLSMGMSHDFEVAIEEGSTCVRVGSAIFGQREKR